MTATWIALPRAPQFEYRPILPASVVDPAQSTTYDEEDSQDSNYSADGSSRLTPRRQVSRECMPALPVILSSRTET